MPTIAIVDDHELLSETLRIALCEAGQDAVRVPVSEPDDVLARLLELRADLVLLDLDLGPSGDATGLIEPLTAAGIRVLVVTGSSDPLRIAAALEQGALGYRSKADGFAALIDTATAALAATRPLDPETRVELLDRLRRTRNEQERSLAPFRRLTEREQATLGAMSRGQSVHEMAADWVVSEATVRTHVRGVLGKLDVRSQLAAVALALRSGWLPADDHAEDVSSPCSTQRAVQPPGITCTTIRRRQLAQYRGGS